MPPLRKVPETNTRRGSRSWDGRSSGMISVFNPTPLNVVTNAGHPIHHGGSPQPMAGLPLPGRQHGTGRQLCSAFQATHPHPAHFSTGLVALWHWRLGHASMDPAGPDEPRMSSATKRLVFLESL